MATAHEQPKCPTCKNSGWVLDSAYFVDAATFPEHCALEGHQLVCPEDCSRARMIVTGRKTLGNPPMKTVAERKLELAMIARDASVFSLGQALASAAANISMQTIAAAYRHAAE